MTAKINPRQNKAIALGALRSPVFVGALALSMAMAMAANSAASPPPPGEADVRGFFLQFVAAQNAHDVKAVAALLWDAPDMLWFTRGVEVRGAQNIAKTLMEYYSGTWHLEPDMTHFRSTAISSDVVQLLVPITFTRGLPGEPSRDDTFLISQTLVHGPHGWRVAAILPIANTQFK